MYPDKTENKREQVWFLSQQNRIKQILPVSTGVVAWTGKQYALPLKSEPMKIGTIAKTKHKTKPKSITPPKTIKKNSTAFFWECIL